MPRKPSSRTMDSDVTPAISILIELQAIVRKHNFKLTAAHSTITDLISQMRKLVTTRATIEELTNKIAQLENNYACTQTDLTNSVDNVVTLQRDLMEALLSDTDVTKESPETEINAESVTESLPDCGSASVSQSLNIQATENVSIPISESVPKSVTVFNPGLDTESAAGSAAKTSFPYSYTAGKMYMYSCSDALAPIKIEYDSELSPLAVPECVPVCVPGNVTDVKIETDLESGNDTFYSYHETRSVTEHSNETIASLEMSSTATDRMTGLAERPRKQPNRHQSDNKTSTHPIKKFKECKTKRQTDMPHYGALSKVTTSQSQAVSSTCDTSPTHDINSPHNGVHSLGQSQHQHNVPESTTKPPVDRKHLCLTCLKGFKTKDQLAQHSLVHSGIRKYSCSYCDKGFKQSCHLQQHITRKHTGILKTNTRNEDKPHEPAVCGTETLYKCDICGEEFSTNSLLKTHTRIHTEEKPYTCEMCDKHFKSKYYLQIHISLHKGETPYKCYTCDKSFTSNSSLEGHNRIHTGEKPFMCNVCGRRFYNGSNLREHISIHTGELPHKCDVCDKRFRLTSNLTTHKRTHTGEKPYICDVCGMVFSYIGVLRSHKLTHTGEKPHKCDVCGKTFSRKGGLQRHTITHTGEKPYTCDVCGKGFNQPGNLRVHNRTHTGGKTYT